MIFKITIGFYLLISMLSVLSTEMFFTFKNCKKKEYRLKNKRKGSLKLCFLAKLFLFILGITPFFQVINLIGNLESIKEIIKMDIKSFKEKYELEEA